MLLIIETILTPIFQKAFVIADSLENKYLNGQFSVFSHPAAFQQRKIVMDGYCSSEEIVKIWDH